MIHQIKADLNAARKTGIKETKYKKNASILSVLFADAMKIGKDKRNDLPTDEECIQSVKRIIKGCRDTIGFIANKDTKQNLQIEELQNEILVLSEYLPRQLSEQDIIAIVKELNEDNIGVVMKHLKENYANQYDGKMVSELVKKHAI